MFFILSKLLGQFVYPLPLLFVGLLTVLVFYHRRYIERVAELILNKFNGLYGTKIELVKHRYKENTRRTRTECYPGVLGCR